MKDRLDFSIIVPSYNAGTLLEPCLRSLVGQITLASYEIILILDGSTDGSQLVAQRWAEQHPHLIRYEFQANHGVGFTRNKALGLARGDWIGFVDSDDLVREDFVESFYRLVKTGEVDLGVCGLRNFSSGEPLVIAPLETARWQVSSPEAVLRTSHQLCTKVFRRSVLDSSRLCFSESSRVGEDLQFIARYLGVAPRVLVTPEVLYYYRQWEGSVTVASRQNLALVENYATTLLSILTHIATDYPPDRRQPCLEAVATATLASGDGRVSTSNLLRDWGFGDRSALRPILVCLEACWRVLGPSQRLGHLGPRLSRWVIRSVCAGHFRSAWYRYVGLVGAKTFLVGFRTILSADREDWSEEFHVLRVWWRDTLLVAIGRNP